MVAKQTNAGKTKTIKASCNVLTPEVMAVAAGLKGVWSCWLGPVCSADYESETEARRQRHYEFQIPTVVVDGWNIDRELAEFLFPAYRYLNFCQHLDPGFRHLVPFVDCAAAVLGGDGPADFLVDRIVAVQEVCRDQ